MMPKKMLVLTVLLFTMTIATCSGVTFLEQDIYLIESDKIPIAIETYTLYETETGYFHDLNYELVINYFDEVSIIEGQLFITLNEEFAIVEYEEITKVNDELTTFILTADYDQEIPHVVGTLYELGDQIDLKFPLEAGERLYHSGSSLYPIIEQDGLIPGNQYEILELDTNDFTITPTLITIGAKDTYQVNGTEFTGYLITHAKNNEIIYSYVDDEMKTQYSTYSAMPGFLARRIAEDEIPDLASFTINYYRSGNVIINHPYRSIYSLIEVYTTDPTNLQLEDNRQQILKSETYNNYDRVLVEIKRDQRHHYGKYTLPITNPEFDAFLGSDHFINPHHPEIQPLLDEILAGETDAWSSVVKLIDWIFYNLKGSSSPTTKTTAQILADYSGESDEHSILFAALARAAGIPTKLVKGFAYDGYYWNNQMWNEVWIGEWIAVDPSNKTGHPDALLVKLIDAISISEIEQREALAFTDTDLKIRQVDNLNRKQIPSDLVTGISDKTLIDADYGLAITIPETWFFLPDDSGTYIAIDQNQIANIVVDFFYVPYDVKPEWLIDQYTAEVKEVFSEYDFYGPEPAKERAVANRTGLYSSWGLEIEGMMLYQELIMVVADDICYTIVITLPAMFHQNYEADIASILSNIIIY